ncbi:ATP-binding cassette domain-containing protein [Microvirga pakistanensis]|uniref:ATP-binding cassette domain-containing protein n=1 Tax=Microvirga pakistanensis TaxID=1682650 RepID=UPI00106CDF4A|nr:ATP-binding cassette domain-containing protein [Microvirga pakistanensis]
MTEALLEAKGLVKQYGQIRALRGADFSVYSGEVVALVGDNGAGKSTLVKTLSGVITPDSGTIKIEGAAVQALTPIMARQLGIETVYQDLALAPTLDPVANLFLGRELLRKGLGGRLGFLDKRAMRMQGEVKFRELGIRIQDMASPVSSMSGGQRQGIAVSRAAAWASKIIFLDEPTAALGVVQTRSVLDLIRRVRDTGIGVVLISHSMPDVLAVSDRIEVLRLGRRVARFKTSKVTTEDIVAAMTGATVQMSGDNDEL